MSLLVLKSFIKGYFRKDGTWVKGHTDKRSKQDDTSPYKGEVSHPYHASQGSLFGGGFSAPSKAAAKKPAAKPKAYHPNVDDHGKKVAIWHPHEATDPLSWDDPVAIARVTPGGVLPAALNGVPFEPWTDHPQTTDGWEFVEGQLHDEFEEPDLVVPKGYSPAAGVIIEEPDGRVWIIHPTNAFAGYKATFPKGHADDGMSLQASAIKECFEESGLQVRLTGLLGDVKRGQTMTRYYRARRVGGTPSAMGWETQAVSLAPAEDVPDLVNSHYDKKVAGLAGFGEAHPLEPIDDWKQVGKQKGTNPGGFFDDPAGQRWYCKFPKTRDHALNELLAAKLYAALGILVPELKLIEQDGDVGLASKVVDGVKLDKAAITAPGSVPGAWEGFAADAWLANWDAVGLEHDNLLVQGNGTAIRIDVGGALVFRAQGESKGKAFGDTVGEVDVLRSGKNPAAASVFGKIPDAAVADGVVAIARLPDNEIRGLVEAYGPGGRGGRERLADRLIARKRDLVARFLEG